jgi:hypothetical protein
MLHRDCDWRWPETGQDTIWYPTMRLFHQKAAGDWTGVMENIFDELRLFRRRLPTRQDAAAQYRSPDREGVDSR